MEEPGFRSIVNSAPFRFLVGPSKDVFYVHRHLLSLHSATLSTLATGHMSEASSGCAELTDIDANTFARVTEFMYTGDYTVPKPEIVLAAKDISVDRNQHEPSAITHTHQDAALADDGEPTLVEVPPPAADDTMWDFQSNRNKKALKNKSLEPRRSRRDRLWAAFKNKSETLQHTAWEPRENTDRCEDFTKVLLCHVQLYTFSDRYGIGKLATLSLQKLRLTLSRFTLHKERVPDVIELIRYTYSHTMTRDDATDDLRRLILEYVVCHAEKLIESEGLLLLLEEGGALASDITVNLIACLD